MRTPDHPTGDGGCGCGHLLCEWCGNPSTPTVTVLKYKHGGPKRRGQSRWVGVHEDGKLVTFATSGDATRWMYKMFPKLVEEKRLIQSLCVEIDGDHFDVATGRQVEVVIP